MRFKSNITEILTELKASGKFDGRFMLEDVVNDVEQNIKYKKNSRPSWSDLHHIIIKLRVRKFANLNDCFSVGNGEYVNIYSDEVNENDIEYITKMNNSQIKARQKKKRMFKQLEGQMVAKFDLDNNFAGYEEHKAVNQ